MDAAVDWFVFAEYAKMTGNSAVIVGAGIDTVVARHIEEKHGFYLVELYAAFRWSLHKSSVGETVSLALHVLDPDAATIGEIETAIQTNADYQLPYHSRAPFVQVQQISFATQMRGEHFVEVSIDNKVLARHYISVDLG